MSRGLSRENPSLIDNQQWVDQHPALHEYLKTHPYVRREFKSHPYNFMHRAEQEQKQTERGQYGHGGVPYGTHPGEYTHGGEAVQNQPHPGEFTHGAAQVPGQPHPEFTHGAEQVKKHHD